MSDSKNRSCYRVLDVDDMDQRTIDFYLVKIFE